jgi:hypothetical protein
MSELLERLDELGARFAPHAYDFTLDLGPMLAASSPGARSFFAYANEEKGPAITLDRLYEPAWRDDPTLLRRFSRLDLEEQVEVLTLYSVPIHENRHHVDFSMTTFGAEFYLLLASEYLTFQQLSPYLLQNQEVIPRGPLRRLESHLDALGRTIPQEWQPRWAEFEGGLRSFEAGYDFRGVNPETNRARTRESDGRVHVLGRHFVPVTVNDLVWSLAPVDRTGWYMRASTLHETRAVSASLLWILAALEGEPSLGGALTAYVACHYGPDAPYDYRFTLDMAACWLGAATFEDLLEAEAWEALRSVLYLLSVAGWFALNGAVKRTPEGQLVRNNPFLRFVFALQELDLAYRDGAKVPAVELLRDFDRQQRAQGLGFLPVEQALVNALRELDAAANSTVPQIWHRGVRKHFAHVFDVVTRALRQRLDEGYMSALAAPADGNPIPWLGGPNEFLIEQYEPDRWVGEWFAFRNRSLFTPAGIWTRDRLREQFGLVELAIPCDCGAMISAPVPRWREHHAVHCHCGRIHRVSAGDVTHIPVPHELEG